MPPPTVRYTCPHCERRVSGPASAAGKTAACPACGNRFTLVVAAEEPQRPPPIVRPALPPGRPEPAEPPAPPVFVPAPRPPARPAGRVAERPADPAVDDRMPRSVRVEHRARGSFGTGLKLTLGVITAVGLVVTGLVLVVCVLPLAGMGVAGGRAAEARRQADAKAMGVTDPDTGKAAPPAAVSPTEPPRAGPKQAAVLGDVEVRITAVTAGTVPLDGIGGRGESENRHLRLAVQVSTRSQTKKVDYQSWQGGFRSSATCKDNFGNGYKAITFGFSNTVVGHVASASVSAGRPANDVLVFELPIPTAEYLDVDLDGDNVDERAAFRFRIPASAWAGRK